jgi:hypothetical protein
LPFFTSLRNEFVYSGPVGIYGLHFRIFLMLWEPSDTMLVYCLCKTSLRVGHTLSRHPNGGNVMCVQRGLWYGEFICHHMLRKEFILWILCVCMKMTRIQRYFIQVITDTMLTMNTKTKVAKHTNGKVQSPA